MICAPAELLVFAPCIREVHGRRTETRCTG